MSKIIAIDFDGTIATINYPECGELIEGAKETINKLYSDGYFIIIWTCRYGEAAELAKKFLNDNEINYHTFNEHSPELIELYNNDTRKISADVYIDDRQLGGLPSWEEIYKILKEKHNI